MAKKNYKNKKNEVLKESDALPLLEFKFDEPLFQMASHPEEPIIATGLSNGYIYCYRYNPQGLMKYLKEQKKAFKLTDEKTGEKNEVFWKMVNVPQDKGTGQTNDGDDDNTVTLMWKTRRHKGSVRCIAMDPKGKFIYSIGTDNILKKADVMSGKVIQKTNIQNDNHKFSKMTVSSTHPILLLGDEVGNVFTIDTKTFKLLNVIKGIHGGDSINDIFHFAKRSVYKFISAGETTLAYWDCRSSNENDSTETDELKRTVVYSDDQEDEILCGTFLDPEEGETVVCGMGEGVVTIWKPEKNDLEDQMSRIKITKDESVECIVPTLQDDNCVWCGCSNGKLYKVDIKGSRISEIRTHNSVDEVQFLDIDYDYRLVSGGMDNIKIWESQNREENDFDPEPSENESNSESNSDPDSDLEDSSDDEGELSGLSREELIAELDKDLVGEDNSDSEETPDVNRDDSGSKSQKRKSKSLNSKQNKKIKQEKRTYNDSHGITKFEDL
ncbi:similar to Saccharomyces cerevisiae YPR169W JIP5 Essential protein required for biogenesis of the large ribosomal subunit [Maudiozyma saulgeensis]|uniref:WD repeat-containing protein JIP5 n=1 Tax=Maudiozyma saulgeensis TaxID=1789683 RepID=A0A1X7R2N1_9SACH|nr:similar to Saccharomyces cerevisiae YPR169W JIP5 Essential protein required for biogenesis of the large ribosomal subunit [Kazachstania saulgeensis]